MNILVIGCGNTGALLAAELALEGHDVSVLAEHDSARSLLPEDFGGYFSVGLLTDQDALKSAGIENCDAVAAVSESDNVNLMVAQMADKVFQIPQIVTALRDPVREQLFGSMMTTVCPTNIAVSSLKGYLLKREQHRITLGNSTVTVELMPVPDHLFGYHAREITCRERELILGVLHADDNLTLTPDDRYPLREGDRLAIARVID